jgi:hypothetical protein
MSVLLGFTFLHSQYFITATRRHYEAEIAVLVRFKPHNRVTGSRYATLIASYQLRGLGDHFSVTNFVCFSTAPSTEHLPRNYIPTNSRKQVTSSFDLNTGRKGLFCWSSGQRFIPQYFNLHAYYAVNISLLFCDHYKSNSKQLLK